VTESRSGPLLPGSTLGVLGGGQLGRMFAASASRLGYRVHVFAPGDDPPAAQVAHVHTAAEFDDGRALRRFSAQVDAVTYETENLPVDMVTFLSGLVPVRPGPEVLAVAQDRAAERHLLHRHGLPVADFRIARSARDVLDAWRVLGEQAVAKTTRGGYDGKGQAVLREQGEAAKAWEDLAAPELLIEALVNFEAELSVIVARDASGDVRVYGPMRNVHVDHVLDTVVHPAGLGDAVVARAREIGRAVAEALEVVGVLCVEMFLMPAGEILINELAARPHNSGHLTIEAFHVSQFDQQARALAGLPLGPTGSRVTAAAMANLLGRHLPREDAGPAWERAHRVPSLSWHLYGKSEPAPGRKMGHVTATADCPAAALAAVRGARDALNRQESSSSGVLQGVGPPVPGRIAPGPARTLGMRSPPGVLACTLSRQPVSLAASLLRPNTGARRHASHSPSVFV
jgi:5-(carboxyamino)imidazole ribonucleotide synthase